MIVASKLVPVLVFSVFLASSVLLSFPAESICPSGHAGAKLTGWQLNKKMPLGTASYVESTKNLKVDVSSVDLPNGTVLSVYVDENRIGDMPPLADGVASVVLSHAVPDGARVRVLSADRPIVSANLQCVDAPKAVPTTNPRSTPTPRPTQAPSPSPTSTPLPSPTLQPVPTPTVSPTPSPSPAESPTPDPMPKSSPAPSPSPGD
jgi:hypothetical protein